MNEPVFLLILNRLSKKKEGLEQLEINDLKGDMERFMAGEPSNEAEGLMLDHCKEVLFLLHKLTHLKIDVEAIADTHHSSPELALMILDDMSDKHYQWDILVVNLGRSLKTRIHFLKEMAERDRLAREQMWRDQNELDEDTNEQSRSDFNDGLSDSVRAGETERDFS